MFCALLLCTQRNKLHPPGHCMEDHRAVVVQVVGGNGQGFASLLDLASEVSQVHPSSGVAPFFHQGLE